MIRKPAGTWGRESPAVSALRNAASTGRAAVDTGVRVWRGLWLCGLGSMFLFGALTSGLFMGSIPSLIGCGLLGWLCFSAGRRQLRPRSQAGAGRSAAPDPQWDDGDEDLDSTYRAAERLPDPAMVPVERPRLQPSPAATAPRRVEPSELPRTPTPAPTPIAQPLRPAPPPSAPQSFAPAYSSAGGPGGARAAFGRRGLAT